MNKLNGQHTDTTLKTNYSYQRSEMLPRPMSNCELTTTTTTTATITTTTTTTATKLSPRILLTLVVQGTSIPLNRHKTNRPEQPYWSELAPFSWSGLLWTGYTFIFISNSIFYLNLELLTKFWKTSLKVALQLLCFIVDFYTISWFWKKKSNLRLGRAVATELLNFGQNLRLKAKQPRCL